MDSCAGRTAQSPPSMLQQPELVAVRAQFLFATIHPMRLSGSTLMRVAEFTDFFGNKWRNLHIHQDRLEKLAEPGKRPNWTADVRCSSSLLAHRSLITMTSRQGRTDHEKGTACSTI